MYLYTHQFCICIQDKKKKLGSSFTFWLLQSVYDSAAAEKDTLALSVSCNGFFSRSSRQYQEIRGHGKTLVFSDAPWAKQPWDCLIAAIEKLVTWQKHTMIGKESALCSGSLDLHYT